MNKLNRLLVECIHTIAEEFCFFPPNFIQEADLEGRLLSLLREKDKMSVMTTESKEVKLAHAQWPHIKKSKIAGFYDIVVWDPKSAKRVGKYWGARPKERSIYMQLQAVIEIKHKRADLGISTGWWEDDINKLRTALKTRKTNYAYYLVFVDNDDEGNKVPKFENIRSELNNQIQKIEKLEIAVVSRTKTEDIWI